MTLFTKNGHDGQDEEERKAEGESGGNTGKAEEERENDSLDLHLDLDIDSADDITPEYLEKLAAAIRSDSGAARAQKPSLFSRVRNLFRRRVALWVVTPADADDESILYAAHSKKEAFLAANYLVYRHFYAHFSMWVPLHGYDRDTSSLGVSSDAWREYLALNLDEANSFLSTIAVRKAVYDKRGLAAMIRMLCGVAPLGLPSESADEVGYWLGTVSENLAKQRALEEAAFHEKQWENLHEKEGENKEGKEDEKEKKAKRESAAPSAPLDKTAPSDHNDKDGAETKRKAGRPRKKDGAPKKTPHAKKGDPNGN